jgi:hypothetical protein
MLKYIEYKYKKITRGNSYYYQTHSNKVILHFHHIID